MLEFLDQLIKPIALYRSEQTERNIFSGISDVFYRENFHSDILAYYLQDELVKRKLIDWINSSLKDEKVLVFDDYRNGYVIREQGRVDISVYSFDKEKVILIENKSNDAGDQDRQLPRYCQQLKGNEKKVEAILYLNKSSLKKPCLEGWTKEEKQTIYSILVPGQLVGVDSFCSSVIDGVLAESNDIRLSGISLEIKKLFQNIVFGGMNMEDLSAFASEIQSGNNLENLKKVIIAYNDLPKYWREHYKIFLEGLKKNGEINSKFNIGSYRETCVYIDGIVIDNVNFGIDIWFSHDFVDYSILTRRGSNSDIEKLKGKLGSQWQFGSEMLDGRFRLYNKNVFDDNGIKNQIKSLIASLEKAI